MKRNSLSDSTTPRTSSSPVTMSQHFPGCEKSADGGYQPAKEALPGTRTRRCTQEREGTQRRRFRTVTRSHCSRNPRTTSVASQALVKSVLMGGDPELRKALGLSSMLDAEIATDSLRLQGITAAANAGSPEALAILGRNYEKGFGVRRDVVLACSYYIRALRMDWPRASELLSRLVHEQGVISHIRTQARHNDFEAQYVWVALLGLGYEGLLFKEQSILTPGQAIQMLQGGCGSRTCAVDERTGAVLLCRAMGGCGCCRGIPALDHVRLMQEAGKVRSGGRW